MVEVPEYEHAQAAYTSTCDGAKSNNIGQFEVRI